LRDYDSPVQRGLRAALILACGLVAAGFSERSEPVGPAEELFPLTITTAERSLTIPSPPQRIAVLEGGPDSLLEALDAPVVASNVAVADLESLRPDLVVAPATASETELSEAAAAGAPVYVTQDTSITEIERAVTQLGLIVAEPSTARRLVRGIEQQRQRLRRLLRGRPRTTVFVDFGRRETASDNTLVGDLIREARGRNAGADVPEGIPVPVDELVALDPEVYVSVGGPTLEQLRKGVRTRQIRAVKSGRVHAIDERFLSATPAVAQGLGRLARVLHPDAFR
jgi:ABC-type Fe3+-hydroxamate transport system substrate-binding protein